MKNIPIILSAIYPGLGHVYLKDSTGIIFIVAWSIGIPLLFLLNGWLFYVYLGALVLMWGYCLYAILQYD